MSGEEDIRADLGIINQSLTKILIKRSGYIVEFSVFTQKHPLVYNMYIHICLRLGSQEEDIDKRVHLQVVIERNLPEETSKRGKYRAGEGTKQGCSLG